MTPVRQNPTWAQNSTLKLMLTPSAASVTVLMTSRTRACDGVAARTARTALAAALAGISNLVEPRASNATANDIAANPLLIL
jgi:hypothetical protein